MANFFSSATGAPVGSSSTIWGDILKGGRDIFADVTGYLDKKDEREFVQSLVSGGSVPYGALYGYSGSDTGATDSFAAGRVNYQALGAVVGVLALLVTVYAVFFKR